MKSLINLNWKEPVDIVWFNISFKVWLSSKQVQWGFEYLKDEEST